MKEIVKNAIMEPRQNTTPNTTLDFGKSITQKGGNNMTREELKEQIDELMRQYADEEIDGVTYAEKMMELTTSARDEIDEDK